MASGGITDKIQILEETAYADGGAAGEVVFGVTKSFQWTADTSTIKSYGLESTGPQGTHLTDGVLQITGTHEFEITDGREFKAIFGSLPTNTGGNFTLDVANTLPSYSVKVMEDGEMSTFLIIKGLKYTQFTINMARDEVITVSADFIAKSIATTTTFTPSTATGPSLSYLDGCFQIDSVTVTGVESVSFVINRNCVPRRFIECGVTSGTTREINRIIEGPLDVSYTCSTTTKRSIIEQIWGGSVMTDVRSNVTFRWRAVKGTAGLELNTTGGRVVTYDRTLDKTQEVALIEFSGVALDISGTGTYNS